MVRKAAAIARLLELVHDPKLSASVYTFQINPDELIVGNLAPCSVGQDKEFAVSENRGHSMRFKSVKSDGLQAFAISGVNTVSFAITATDDAKKNLLGFAVERGMKGGKMEFRPGFKVFASMKPKPGGNAMVSTKQHPVQSFVWDDFTARPGTEYVYRFHPMRGTPKKPDLSADPVEIRIRTEVLFSEKKDKNEHDVFFNRGVASSQAYARRFGNRQPNKLQGKKKAEALEWLSRQLDEAILKFIDSARKGDGLLCCFYEFRYEPVVLALKAAVERGADVQVIVDGKENGRYDKKKKKHEPPFPRKENLKMIKDTGFPIERVKLRQARKSEIHHNKFIVLLKGKSKKPTEVWTGSTNISESGFHGQTNVGHWVRNNHVAKQFQAYWKLLSTDPGGQTGDDRSTAMAKNKKFRLAVEQIQDLPTDIKKISKGVTAVFSPRTATTVLDTYFEMIDKAKSVACITLAFGVAVKLKNKLSDNRPEDQIIFMLLEKEDKPAPKKKKPPKKPPAPFVRLTAKNNVYQAYGQYLSGDPVYRFARETNTRALQLSKHVAYIHSKFLLMDPLSDDPVVVTGSANFSDDSTDANDENMLIIRGDRRAADIYFTEFQRLFNHYYFRAVNEKAKNLRPKDPGNNLFLRETPAEWLKNYKPGSLRMKRVEMFAKMRGFTKL
jgi:phosphatidylserine/phosphatidylglycerophosphate/cardiolipin synthase-like enzyme